MATDQTGAETARDLLVGREVSAICFVRDYVEIHFDGPIVRALTHPFGMWEHRIWRFPDVNAPSAMLAYIGQSVDDFEVRELQYAQLAFRENSFTIPLDEAARVGPEALNVVGVDLDDRTDPSHFWVW